MQEELLQYGSRLNAQELQELQELVRSIPVADHVYDHILQLTRGTRVRSNSALPFAEQWITFPRFVLGGGFARAWRGRSEEVSPA